VALIKQRPTIGLLAPSFVRAGEHFVMRVTLDCPAALEVDAISVEIVGLEVYYSESQYGRHANNAVFCRATKEVGAKQELTPGKHEFEVEFIIPEQFASSYVGKNIRVEWETRVHVDIPWWPDARASFTLHVRPSASGSAPSSQKIWSSRPEGPIPGKPHLELSVGTTHIEPGGVLSGAVALANTAQVNYRAMEFRLIATERQGGGLVENRSRVTKVQWRVDLESPEEDEPTQFTLRLPSDLVPGFEMRRIGLEWWLRVDADVPWTIDPSVWVPLTVRPRAVAAGALGPAPLAIGSERIELIWRKVGDETGFNFVDGVLRREVGHTRLEVRREHQAKRGGIVVAEIDYPDLGIGLRWDQKLGLVARDEGQATVLRVCLAQDAGERLSADVDDDRFQLVLADTGRAVETLRDFVAEVFQIGRAVEHARLELPAPAAVEGEVILWRRVARGLGGSLSVPGVAIRGSRDETDFYLGLSWKPTGEPDAYELRVQASVPIDARQHLDWSVGDAPIDSAQEAHELTQHADRVWVDRSGIQIWINRAETNVDSAAAVLERALGVVVRLTGGAGPYR
jgi:hypothetical protein